MYTDNKYNKKERYFALFSNKHKQIQYTLFLFLNFYYIIHSPGRVSAEIDRNKNICNGAESYSRCIKAYETLPSIGPLEIKVIPWKVRGISKTKMQYKYDGSLPPIYKDKERTGTKIMLKDKNSRNKRNPKIWDIDPFMD